MLGVPFTAQQVTTFLSRLSFPFTQEGDTFLVTPPSYRFDIAIENDLIEEITRLHGYDNIPAHPPVGQIAMLKAPESRRAALAIKLELAARGFQEVINFAFVPETWEADFTANANPIRLANPIASHLAVMRSSLVGGLVENLVQNLKRKQTRVRIFEEGRCFLRQVGTIAQPWRLAALIYGQAAPETWDADARKADFFDLKSEVLALFAPTEAAQITFIPTTHPALHPGRAARILLADREIGHLGELHPGWAQKYALPTAPTLFEIDRDALTGMALPTYREVPRFQIATRDLAILVDQSLAWQDVLTGLQQAAPALVRDIQLFDLYQGKGVPAGKKSLAFRVVMQDTERTLSDAGMDVAIAKITTWLEQHCQAVLRA
jgi:phenylalanyl-tRNA synthetase beta chain